MEMKQDITGIVALCQTCHKAFIPGESGEAYTCDACMGTLTDEPKVRDWDDYVSTPDAI